MPTSHRHSPSSGLSPWIQFWIRWSLNFPAHNGHACRLLRFRHLCFSFLRCSIIVLLSQPIYQLSCHHTGSSLMVSVNENHLTEYKFISFQKKRDKKETRIITVEITCLLHGQLGSENRAVDWRDLNIAGFSLASTSHVRWDDDEPARDCIEPLPHRVPTHPAVYSSEMTSSLPHSGQGPT